MNIQEKHAEIIQDNCMNGASQSDIMSMLDDYTKEINDTKKDRLILLSDRASNFINHIKVVPLQFVIDLLMEKEK